MTGLKHLGTLGTRSILLAAFLALLGSNLIQAEAAKASPDKIVA
jgi:hypothetical protein